GILVELVHHAVDRVTVERLVIAPQLALGRRVRDLLHADDNVHGRWPTSHVRVRRHERSAPDAQPRLPGPHRHHDSGCPGSHVTHKYLTHVSAVPRARPTLPSIVPLFTGTPGQRLRP